MSLTGEIDRRGSPVRRFFETYFPDLSGPRAQYAAQVRNAVTIRPDTDRRLPSAIGTAFDYRLRYCFAATPVREFVATRGMESLIRVALLAEAGVGRGSKARAGLARLPREGEVATLLIADLLQSVDDVVSELAPGGRRLEPAEEERLCRYCYVLALYEELFRAGVAVNSPLYSLSPDATLDDLLTLPDPLWVADLGELTTAFYEHFAELTNQETILNPKFAGSRDIGGADAGLIVDHCLIEVKTTIRPQPSLRRWRWKRREV